MKETKCLLVMITFVFMLFAFVSIFLLDIAKEQNNGTIERNVRALPWPTHAENKGNKTTWILSWRRPWGYKFKGHDEGHATGSCKFTYDRSKLKQSKAVLFHYTSLDEEEMPWAHYRSPSQIFVFWFNDNPSYARNGETRHPNRFDGGFINWTMSYLQESDVFMPYLEPKVAENIFNRKQDDVNMFISKKTRVALWVVNDCELLRGSKLRMKYANALVEAGLPLDRYGWCFSNKQAYKKLSDEVLLSYKFYLAFEDAEKCRDYVTEEFWKNGIEMGRVPVVWGPKKKDLEYLAPPGSYIHTEDFESPAKLVEYLLYLDKNDEAYREYFNWVRNPGTEVERLKKLYQQTWQERLCEKVLSNQPAKAEKFISYIQYGKDWGQCIDV
ncbi:3-galactosyl-N-acetylglucosaminide 4-alpha-L-fucosyltransferase FUT3-like [Ciona intestinalis]